MIYNIAIDVDVARLVVGRTNPRNTNLPLFVQGDTGMVLRIRLLKDLDGATNTYTQIAVSGVTIQAATLGRKIGSTVAYYTQQFTWSASTDLADPYWYANFPLNTNAITLALGTSASIPAFFEVRMTDSDGTRTVLSRATRLQAAVLHDGGLEAAALPTALTQELGNALYLRRTIEGPFFIKNLATGQVFQIMPGDDGALHADPIS